MPAIAFYISGHGFGHASRQVEIINTLAPRLPAGWTIVVRTAAARWLFDRTVRAPMTLLPGPTDTGVVQIDSLHLDEAGTARNAGRFFADWTDRVGRDAALLHHHDVRLVVADAPPLACAAAAAAGLDSIVCANFTWDWIYEGYAEAFAADAPDVLPLIRQAYASAAHAWRLPMHGGFTTIGDIRDVPFVARHATRSRDEVIAALDLPSGKPLALASFGGCGLDHFDWARLDCVDDWTIVITSREPRQESRSGTAHVAESVLYARGLRYEDLVAAVDVVVTKPGYGIVSECVANGTALLYTSRGRFVEYDVMAREMPEVLRCGYVEQEALLAGRWLDGLNRTLACLPPPRLAQTNGADVIADAILRML